MGSANSMTLCWIRLRNILCPKFTFWRRKVNNGKGSFSGKYEHAQ